MAVHIMERGDIVKGIPVVHPTDDLFWFNRPRFLLYLIHFVLFQNAFQLAFFAWSWCQFSFPSCFHKRIEDIIIRISMGVLIQVICSYLILPLYALVTQMGSNMKATIFSERVATALRKWHNTARKHLKESRQSSSAMTPLSTSRPATPSHGLSPVHLLRRYRNDVDSLQASPQRYTIDDERFDLEGTPSHHTISASSFHHMQQGEEDGGREMQELGDITEQQLPHDIDSNQGSSISIDFSFDK